MTLDEFLDDYVPRVLKPLGGWQLGDSADFWPVGIRRNDSCPLTAERDLYSDRFMSQARRLRIKAKDARTIACAADGESALEPLTMLERVVRARLLAGLGLQETGVVGGLTETGGEK